MTLAVVFGAWLECAMFTGAWRRRQIPKRCVLAHVALYDYQILKSSGSRDNKAVLAARVTDILARSREFVVACVRVPGATVCA